MEILKVKLAKGTFSLITVKDLRPMLSGRQRNSAESKTRIKTESARLNFTQKLVVF